MRSRYIVFSYFGFLPRIKTAQAAEKIYPHYYGLLAKLCDAKQMRSS